MKKIFVAIVAVLILTTAVVLAAPPLFDTLNSQAKCNIVEKYTSAGVL